MKWTLRQTLLLWTAFFVAMHAYAGGNFTYTGRILDASGNPVVANSVRFTLTIYEPTGKCWLYTEQRELDLSASAGTFSIDIGANDASLVAATALFNGSVTGPQTMRDVFDNVKSYSGLGGANGCTGIYTPNSSEPNAGRLLSVFFTVDGGPNQALPVLKINPVPAALQAYAVNGFGSGELLKINPTDVAASSVPNNALTQVQYEEFWRLVKNPLAAYLPVSGDVTLVSGNNKVTTLLGQTLPAGPATNGQVLVSNGTTWTLQAVGGGSVTSVAATAPIASSGGATPTISISKADSSTDGYLDKNDFAAFSAKQSNALADSAIWIGNSSGGAQARAMSGDATISNAGVLTLSSTITAGGPVGSAGYVPVITYDAKGRLTAVTSAAVNDTSKLPLAGGTMSGALNMGGQDLNNVGNINMAANKYFSLSANSTDGTVAGQIWYDGGTIKYFDGSAVRSLGVAGAGITNFNGLSAGTQNFAIGTSGNAPAFNSVTSTHTLNIPMASAAGSVTAGLISNAEYTALNAKQSNTLASANVWIGNASGGAQARAVSGDISLDNTGTTSLTAIKGKSLDATAASAMGQVIFYDSVADKWKVSAAAAPSNGQVMKWNDTTKTWEPGNDTGGWTAVDASYAAKGIVQFDTDAATSGVNVASGVANIVRTTTGTSSTILSLDGSGVANMYGAGLKGATSGTLALQASGTTANYSLTFPAAAPGAGQSLQSDAAGNFTWVNALTTATGIVKDGNSFGSNLVIGTNDNYDFSFEANGATAMTIKPNGNVGIGTADPLYKLYIEDTTINNPDKRMAVTRAVSQSTVDGAYTSIGSDSRANEAVATGVTNTGTVRGSWIAAQRNAQLGVDDDGTLTNLEGAVLQYGHFAVNTGADPKTTNLYGIKLDANYRRGTITNLYDLYIGAGTGGTGTVSNHYSIYQQSSTAKNYLNGSVGIGALTPATKLDVSGVTRTTGLDVNATYGGSQVSLRAPGAFTSYTLTLPTTVGTSGQFLQTNGSGVLSWAGVTINDTTKLPLAGGTMSGAINMGGQDITNTGNISMAANKYFTLSANSTNGTAAGQMWYDAGTIKYHDGSTVKSLGVAGAGITNLNGLTSSTQTFAIGTSGDAPAFNSATNTHTLNIPMASSAGTVTAGLLSNAEYAALNNKQSSTLANGQVWVGNASNVATATNPATLFVMKGGQAGAVSLGSSDANNLTLLTNNTARLTIDSSGNIGIGAGSVLNKPLDIVGTGATIAGLKRTDDSDGFNNILSLTRTRSSTTLPGAGFGGSIAFSGEYDNANNTTAMGFIGALWENNQTGALANANSAMTFSTAAAGVTNEHVRITSQGRVGINTPSPSYPLSVAGTIESTSGGYRFPDGTTQTTAATNVAASTLASAKIWVGNASNSPEARSLTGDVSAVSNTGSVTIVKTTTGTSNTIVSTDGTGTIDAYGYGIKGTTSGTVDLLATATSANYALRFPAAAPGASQILESDASGNFSWINRSSITDASKLPLAGGTMAGDINMNGNDLLNLYLGAGRFFLGNASNGADTVLMSGDATMSPTGVVTVDKTTTAVANKILQLDANSVANTKGVDATNSQSTVYATSSASLKVPAGGVSVSVNNWQDTSGTASYIKMNAYNTSSNDQYAYIGTVSSAGAGAWTPSIVFGQTTGSTAYSEAMRIHSTGSVGIGATAPATKLDVSGVTRSTGLDVNATYGGSQASIRAPASFTSYTLTLPTTVGTNGQVLTTNGAGVLSWTGAIGAVSDTANLANGKIWVGNASGKAAEVTMSGDVTITNAGVATVDKTQTAVASKILQLTASSVAVTKGEDIGGASTGIVSLRYPSTATNTTLTFPSTAGAANQFLQTNGSGTLTWASQSALLPSLNAGLIWVGNASNGPEARTLSGDVSAVSNAGAVTVVKSTTGTANQIVALDGSSIGTMSGLKLPSGAFNTTLTAATTATGTYVLRLPAAQGAANQVMQNDGSGNLSWVSPVTTSTGIVKDGNSFGAHLIIGTNDNYDFRFEANGATAMTIEPSGEVGIGTTTPGYKLDIASIDGSALRLNTYSATASQGNNVMLYRARGTSAAPTAVQSNDTLGGVYARGYGATSFGSSSTAYLEFSATQNFTDANRGTHMAFFTTATNTSAAAERMRISHDGNVGIGITSPTVGLMVEKDNGNGYSGWFRKSSTDKGVGLGTTTNGDAAMINGLTSAGAATDLAINPNGGMVGVGTIPGGNSRLQVNIAPLNQSLHAMEVSNQTSSTTNGTYYNIGIENNHSKRIDAGVSDAGYLLGLRSNTMRNFNMTGTDSGTLAKLVGMAIQYGNYNSTASSPQTTTAVGLQIAPYIMTGNIGTMYDLLISAPTSGGTVGTYYGVYVAGPSKTNFLEGNTGVGTDTPDQKFVVSNGSTIGKYTTSGWTHSSDVRLKKNIQPLESSLEKILKLEGVSYQFKSDPEGQQQIGFIAQQVEPVFPDVVTTDKDGMKSMVYSNLVAPLVEAVKELYAKILSHDEKFKSLEAENRAMKEALCELGKQQFCFQKRVPASN